MARPDLPRGLLSKGGFGSPLEDGIQGADKVRLGCKGATSLQLPAAPCSLQVLGILYPQHLTNNLQAGGRPALRDYLHHLTGARKPEAPDTKHEKEPSVEARRSCPPGVISGSPLWFFASGSTIKSEKVPG
jgi:hypothetical protein